MIEPFRHVPLHSAPWDQRAAAQAIDEIVADALDQFGGNQFWPAHPLDDGTNDGHSSIYFGAGGVIWALEYLRRVGATKRDFDFRPYLPQLLAKTQAELLGYGDYAAHGSLLFGDLGTALLIMGLDPTPEIAELIYARADANNALPVRELMWGTAGSMIACLHMAVITKELRWRALFAIQAERLLNDLEETDDGPLWTQDLYGQRSRYLGPVHGYAGNMIALLNGWEWSTDRQRARIADTVPRTLMANAWRSEHGISWHAVVGERQRPPWLCQHCHGAPGMVTAFANAPFTTPELEDLLRDGGNFVWAAGPLAKGSNLCHGTGGNGYAFLKLHCRTNDLMWLQRARTFAMTAIVQCREARKELGRGRYSLWTGDLGLAIYVWDCLTAVPRFPTIDIF